MSSLLISIISIALSAALAAAALFYFQGSFGAWNDQAQLSKYLQDVQQVKGALNMYRLDHQRSPVSLDELVDGTYLKAVPVGGWQFSGVYYVSTPQAAVPDSLCLTFNKRLNIHTVPQCNDPAYAQIEVCCKG